MTVDHKVLNEEGESRDNHWCVSLFKILPLNGFSPIRAKQRQETEESLRKFLEPSQNPKVSCTDNYLEIVKICGDLSWNHRTSTPRRSDTNVTAERAVGRVKEGTSAVLLQSGLDEKWWADSMVLLSAKCPGPLGRWENAIRKTIWRTDNGAMAEYHPISPRDQSRLHQFGKKVLPGIFLRSELRKNLERRYSDRGIGRFGKLDASEIYPRRIIGKEVLISQKGDEFIFPVADGTARLSGRDHEFREPTQRRERTVRSENLSGELQGESGESQPAQFTDDVEARAQWTSSSTLFAESRNIPFSTEMHWCNNVSLHWSGRQWPQNSVYWKKNLPKDICGPGRDWAPVHVCQKYGQKLVRIEKNKNGKTSSQFSLLILMTKITTKQPSKMRGEIEHTYGTSYALQKKSSN